jgi:hypothetical protein
MNKSDYLDIIKLLSALESWGFATKERLPDYLHEQLNETIELLSREILE